MKKTHKYGNFEMLNMLNILNGVVKRNKNMYKSKGRGSANNKQQVKIAFHITYILLKGVRTPLNNYICHTIRTGTEKYFKLFSIQFLVYYRNLKT